MVPDETVFDFFPSLRLLVVAAASAPESDRSHCGSRQVLVAHPDGLSLANRLTGAVIAAAYGLCIHGASNSLAFLQRLGYESSMQFLSPDKFANLSGGTL